MGGRAAPFPGLQVGRTEGGAVHAAGFSCADLGQRFEMRSEASRVDAQFVEIVHRCATIINHVVTLL